MPFRKIIFVIVVAGIASGIAAAQPKLKVAVIPKGTTHIFWKSVEAGARAAGNELGVDIIWKGPLKENDQRAADLDR